MNPDSDPAVSPASGMLPCAEVPLVSLMVPTTSQAAALRVCLSSLAAHLPGDVACEVILILNAPTPEVRAVALTEFAGARVVESQVNLGVAGGYNLGRTQARGRFLVLLHDDVEIGPGWLEPLLATAAAFPHAGAVGSRVLNFDGTPQRAGSLIWANGLTTACDSLAGGGPWPVDYTGTCATLVRTDLWDALGGMDERFFPAYYVDVDLCMGLRRLGFLTLCEPVSTLRHHSGASSSWNFRTWLSGRNRELFLTKHGDQLNEAEPWAPDDPSATARALARTQTRAAAVTARPVPSIPAAAVGGRAGADAAQGATLGSVAVSADPATREQRHREYAAEVQRGFVDYLEQQLAEARAESAAERREAQAQRLEQEKLAAMLERKRGQLEEKSQRVTALKQQVADLKAELKSSQDKRRPDWLWRWCGRFVRKSQAR